VLGCD